MATSDSHNDGARAPTYATVAKRHRPNMATKSCERLEANDHVFQTNYFYDLPPDVRQHIELRVHNMQLEHACLLEGSGASEKIMKHCFGVELMRMRVTFMNFHWMPEKHFAAKARLMRICAKAGSEPHPVGRGLKEAIADNNWTVQHMQVFEERWNERPGIWTKRTWLRPATHPFVVTDWLYDEEEHEHTSAIDRFARLLRWSGKHRVRLDADSDASGDEVSDKVLQLDWFPSYTKRGHDSAYHARKQNKHHLCMHFMLVSGEPIDLDFKDYASIMRAWERRQAVCDGHDPTGDWRRSLSSPWYV